MIKAGPENLPENGYILIVDDDEVLRELAKRVAEKSGFYVETARGGKEALECFSANPQKFQLVLLDLTMPRMSGEEVLVKLRKLRKDVKVVLVTGYGEASLTDTERDNSAGLLQKPFSPEALAALLTFHARPTRPPFETKK